MTDQRDTYITVDIETNSPAIRGNALVENVGVQWSDGLIRPMLRKWQALPCQFLMSFSTTDDDQTSLNMDIFRGRVLDAAWDVRLGQLVIEGIEKLPKGAPQVFVQFEAFDKTLSVSIRNPGPITAKFIHANSGFVQALSPKEDVFTRVVKCPNCHQKLRLRSDKMEMTYACPRCSMELELRSDRGLELVSQASQVNEAKSREASSVHREAPEVDSQVQSHRDTQSQRHSRLGISEGSIGMKREWRKVSLQQAKEHPLYGIKNWLAVFAFGVILGPLQALGRIRNSAHELGVTAWQLLANDLANTGFLTFSLVFSVAVSGALLWLLYTLHPRFRVLATIILLCNGPVYILMAILTGAFRMPGVTGALTHGFVVSFFWLFVWAIYLHRSRRVRVTFEHCVLRESERPAGLASDVRKASAPNESDWAGALAEIEEGRVNKGAWARAFAEAGGDDARAKAIYIKTRAELANAQELNSIRTTTGVDIAAASLPTTPLASELPTQALQEPAPYVFPIPPALENRLSSKKFRIWSGLGIFAVGFVPFAVWGPVQLSEFAALLGFGLVFGGLGLVLSGLFSGAPGLDDTRM